MLAPLNLTMNDLETINSIRGIGFLAGVIDRQSHEPLCSRCISYTLTVEEGRKALASILELLKEKQTPQGFETVLKDAETIIQSAPVPEEPVKQRKVGNCKLPDKACFVKKARRLFIGS